MDKTYRRRQCMDCGCRFSTLECVAPGRPTKMRLPPPPRQPMPDPAAVKELRQNGKKYREIAELLGSNISAVWNAANGQYGSAPRGPRS